jgi:flavorubredoxin
MFRIQDHVHAIGIKDPKRRLFDSLVYMPDGTTYNSYVVSGSRYTALIDCSDPSKEHEFLEHVRNAKANIDYIILLHAEQDHSGTIKSVLKMFPGAVIVCTDSVKQLMQIHFDLEGVKFMVVNSGDVLDLGDMTLTFYPIPFAHWPDNTMVHLLPQRILFSSDLFGAHDTDKDIVKEIGSRQYRSTRSYFSEIMMPFRKNLAKHLNTSRSLQPLTVAPAHGPIWADPNQIFALYEEWISDKVKPFVVIPYVTMHESTESAVRRFALQLNNLGVSVSLRNLSAFPESLLIETGELIYDLVDAAAVVFAFPTVLGGPHPAIVYSAVTANAMIPKTLAMGMLCSYAWASKATDVLSSFTSSFRCRKLDPLMFKGLPDNEDLLRIDEYATELAEIVLSLSQ